MMAVDTLNKRVFLNAFTKRSSLNTSVQCLIVNSGVALKKPTRVMKLPPINTRIGATISIIRTKITKAVAAGCHLPSEISPGRIWPVTVVYRFLVSSQR